ncbi:hypothetical protein AGMMS50267_00300 [Spirochaetia bacterium]|nr:hypothetical protein AGMMS50267_00300 [Spirochaetia bacterium]
MSRTDTIHMRIEPGLKVAADAVLGRLGLSTTEAITVAARPDAKWYTWEDLRTHIREKQPG